MANNHSTGPSDSPTVASIAERIRSHTFHPVNEKNRTVDRKRHREGIGDLDDTSGSVRLLAVRDFVRLGEDAVEDIAQQLDDDHEQVRYVCATALGVLGVDTAVAALERTAVDDPSSLVRAQAVVALGQIGAKRSLSLLRERLADDPSKDVRHRIELTVDRIETAGPASDDLRGAYRDLNPETFTRLSAGDSAPAFTLSDTDGRDWQLSDLLRGNTWVVLVWIYADWCHICHSEFDELFELQTAFEREGVAVATLECHDGYRCRVMTGQEATPEYWFTEEEFQHTYTDRIWWPHLVDRAGAVGASYGIAPMAFAVHAEYVNRPSVVVVDADREVRFAYYGTTATDRPSIETTLAMIRSEEFSFEHPDRLTSPTD